MKILAIETSCDETAISLVEAKGGSQTPAFSVLAHLVSSQIDIHREFGGVVPNLAKREHGKNLVPLLIESLKAGLVKFKIKNLKLKIGNSKTKTAPRSDIQTASQCPTSKATINKINKILEREPELKEKFLAEIINLPAPKIDAIAVTAGPGLEPALWAGINFAKALGTLWDLPVVPVNHLEGHLLAVLVGQSSIINHQKVKFPAIGLVISGGHTDIVLIKKWRGYTLIGRTRDDAVGEAFDKVARMLGLPYPGGPEISKLAATARTPRAALKGAQGQPSVTTVKLPRPMLNSGDFDFSFSGLKTAVLYLIKKLGALSPTQKAAIAREFEDSAAEVVVTKTLRAAMQYKAKTIIVGGGVIANRAIREAFATAVKQAKTPTGQPAKITILLPDQYLTGDNATMIAAAAYLTLASKAMAGQAKLPALGKIVADGNLKLGLRT